MFATVVGFILERYCITNVQCEMLLLFLFFENFFVACLMVGPWLHVLVATQRCKEMGRKGEVILIDSTCLVKI